MKPIKTRLFVTASLEAIGLLLSEQVAKKCDKCPHMAFCDPDLPEPLECATCDVEMSEPSKYTEPRSKS